MLKFLKNYLEARRLRREGKKFYRTYKKLVPLILSDINSLEIGHQVLVDLHGSDASSMVWDSILFYKYAILDLIDLVSMLADSKKSNRNMIVRIIAGTLYEFLDDSRYFLSKKFRKKMANMPYSDRFLYEFDNISDMFSLISEEFLKMLADVRHNAAFHKDKNPRIFKKVKNDIDDYKIAEATLSVFYLWGKIDAFHRLFLDCISQYQKDNNSAGRGL